MARIFPGCFSARYEGSFAVFLIGIRINQLWRYINGFLSLPRCRLC
jgi:hypothetical protein